jgi:twitching motility protein PilT
VVTPGIANLIRENKTYRITSSIQTGYKHGMVLMDDSLFKLWRDEKVTIEDALAKAMSPDDLAKRIANAQKGIFDDESDVEDTARAG